MNSINFFVAKAPVGSSTTQASAAAMKESSIEVTTIKPEANEGAAEATTANAGSNEEPISTMIADAENTPSDAETIPSAGEAMPAAENVDPPASNADSWSTETKVWYQSE